MKFDFEKSSQHFEKNYSFNLTRVSFKIHRKVKTSTSDLDAFEVDIS